MDRVQNIEITSSTIFRALLILLGFWFLYVIRDVLIMLLAAFVISSALEPVAKRLQRYRVPRGVSVVVVYVAALLIIGTTIALIAPPLAQQVIQLGQSFPQLLQGLEETIGLTSVLSPETTVTQLQSAISKFGDNLTNLGLNVFEQTRTVFSGIFSLLFVLIIAFYLVLEEDGLKKLFRIVIPRDHLPYVERMVDRVQHKMGRWVLAQLALGVIIGVVVGVGLWLLGVKYALALGLVAGVLEILPVIGPIIAGIFGVIVALSQSVVLGLVTLAFYVVVQQLENHALIPNIMRRATGLNPLVTLIAVLLGGRLAGVVGVLLSVPVATVLSIFMSDLFSTPPVDDELPG